MKMPDLHERIQRLEDETAGLESMFDARTRKLWAEIVKLQGQVRELTEAKNPYDGARSARRC